MRARFLPMLSLLVLLAWPTVEARADISKDAPPSTIGDGGMHVVTYLLRNRLEHVKRGDFVARMRKNSDGFGDVVLRRDNHLFFLKSTNSSSGRRNDPALVYAVTVGKNGKDFCWRNVPGQRILSKRSGDETGLYEIYSTESNTYTLLGRAEKKRVSPGIMASLSDDFDLPLVAGTTPIPAAAVAEIEHLVKTEIEALQAVNDSQNGTRFGATAQLKKLEEKRKEEKKGDEGARKGKRLRWRGRRK